MTDPKAKNPNLILVPQESFLRYLQELQEWRDIAEQLYEKTEPGEEIDHQWFMELRGVIRSKLDGWKR